MGTIFLSYRRGDSTPTCERVYDRLITRFGKDSVFMDVDKIPIGVRFPQYLTSVVWQADVLLAVIGPHWLDIRAADGTRRLDNPDDFVRREIEAALARHIPIVPVLVEGAAMPSAAQLPGSIRELTSYNAVTLRRNPDFDRDVARLEAAITALRVRPHRTPLDRVAALGVYAAFALACATLVGVALVLLGVRLPIGASPLLDLVHRYPIATLLVTGLLTLATLSSVVLLRTGAQPGAPVPEELEASLRTGWRGPRQAIALATSSACALTLFVFLALTLARPSWCPTALCPPPQLVTSGIHDANLDVYLTALQSPTYVIPGDPTQYSDPNLPHTIGAQLADAPTQLPYRVVIGVHSLLGQGNYSLIIEQVQLVVDDVTPLPQTLNVWVAGSQRNYDSNPYQVTYRGQAPGTRLLANYTPVPDGHVQLAPGEADELDLQILSNVPADLRFHVEVTYRVAIEAQTHTIVLPNRFELVFATAANWHQYELVNGHLVASQP